MGTLVRAGSLRAAWLGALVAEAYGLASLHDFFLRVGGPTAVFGAVIDGRQR